MTTNIEVTKLYSLFDFRTNIFLDNIYKTMAQVLDAYVNKSVNIVTSDGRIIIGTLRGFDQAINIILDDSHERVFSATDGVEQVLLGLYIIRGDNVALIGEIDEELDKNIDFSRIRADPLQAAKT
jgi:U6 snRNA-associated Sm-like protein LSm8